MTLFGLVRHGQTNWNLKELFQGSSDIPLNETGKDQAHHALDSFPPFDWDFVVSSDLKRAEETARIIAHDHGLEYRGAFAGLREVDWGWAEGKHSDLVHEAYPERNFPDRESIESVVARGTKTVRSLAAEYPDACILVVSHGTFIRYLLSGVAHRDLTSIPNASLSLLDVEPQKWSVPMIAGYSLKEPFVWDHDLDQVPTVEPGWDLPDGVDPADLPHSSVNALEAFRKESK